MLSGGSGVRPVSSAVVAGGIASFAQVVASSRAGGCKSRALVISPREGSELDSAEKLKEDSKRRFDPDQEGWKVVGLRKRGSRSVVLETEASTRGQVELEDARWAAMGVTIKELGKAQPRVVIYDVSRDLSDEEAIERIRGQNFEGMSAEEFRAKCKVQFRSGRRNLGVVNLVLEVAPAFRAELVAKGRVYVHILCLYTY